MQIDDFLTLHGTGRTEINTVSILTPALSRYLFLQHGALDIIVSQGGDDGRGYRNMKSIKYPRGLP
jgi:hypothetical protein